MEKMKKMLITAAAIILLLDGTQCLRQEIIANNPATLMNSTAINASSLTQRYYENVVARKSLGKLHNSNLQSRDGSGDLKWTRDNGGISLLVQKKPTLKEYVKSAMAKIGDNPLSVSAAGSLLLSMISLEDNYGLFSNPGRSLAFVNQGIVAYMKGNFITKLVVQPVVQNVASPVGNFITKAVFPLGFDQFMHQMPLMKRFSKYLKYFPHKHLRNLSKFIVMRQFEQFAHLGLNNFIALVKYLYTNRL